MCTLLIKTRTNFYIVYQDWDSRGKVQGTKFKIFRASIGLQYELQSHKNQSHFFHSRLKSGDFTLEKCQEGRSFLCLFLDKGQKYCE